MTGKHTFPAGKYWIGDPCYAIADNNWGMVIDETGCFGHEKNKKGKSFDGSFYYNGEKCFAAGTKYGDGVFVSNNGLEFGVDAGLLGILPIEACDGDSLYGGNVVDFQESFYVWADDGYFYFGGVFTIETDDTEEDEEDYNDYDDDWGDDDDEDEDDYDDYDEEEE